MQEELGNNKEAIKIGISKKDRQYTMAKGKKTKAQIAIYITLHMLRVR
jgi:hypothetical protein